MSDPRLCVEHAHVFHRAEVRGAKRPDGLTEVEAEAISLCLRCPLVGQCAEYALANDFAGVCGALTRDQRLELRERDGLLTDMERWELNHRRRPPGRRAPRNVA